MQCYTCGREMASGESTCRSCGWHRSKLIYTPFCGVVGGFVGSLIGFTFFDMTGALLGGLFGIVVAEASARRLLRPRRSS